VLSAYLLIHQIVPSGIKCTAVMKNESEMEAREQLTHLWIEAETVVRAFVFSAISSFADAEDVVQKVALTVARRFDEYDQERSFEAWAIWIAKSRVIDHYRVKGREKLMFSESLLDGLAESLISQQAKQSNRAAAMEQCIEKLPDKSRLLLKLRYDEGDSAKEIAKVMKSSAASVRVMLHKVRNMLADCINLQLSGENQC
jgi:RNA polymerase sigma-70 factor (ECF subfamily)